MDESEIVELYTKDKWTLRRIADKFYTDHHRIKRILVKNCVELSRVGRQPKPFTDEHKRKISEATKGRTSWIKGKKATLDMRYKNMRGKLKTTIDLTFYADIEKLKILTKYASKHKKYIGYNDFVLKIFLDKFYFDPAFNAVYDLWIKSNKCKWFYPSFDHKIAKSNGGNFDIDNLQVLTWFENRAKAEMSQEEWDKFKLKTGTTSSLFIDSILDNY